MLAGDLVSPRFDVTQDESNDSRRSHRLQLGSKLGWIGVDLGTHTVKLAQAVRTPDGVRLRHAAVIQRPSPWPEGDALAVDEPDSSWPEIRAALECGGFRGRNAACVLPMNVCELRGLKVPQGDVHERRAMIASELADDEAESPTAGRVRLLGTRRREGHRNRRRLQRQRDDGHAALDRSGRQRLPERPASIAGPSTARRSPWPARSPWPHRAAEQRSHLGRRLGFLEHDAGDRRPKADRSTPAGCTIATSAKASPRFRAVARRDARSCPAPGRRPRRVARRTKPTLGSPRRPTSREIQTAVTDAMADTVRRSSNRSTARSASSNRNAASSIRPRCG